jgi:predicted nucleic acid-binding protein
MNACFADTFFYIAMLDKHDQHHERINDFIGKFDGFYVTTRWVLAEVANALSDTPRRAAASLLIQRLNDDPSTLIVKSSDLLFEQGMSLYTGRQDKGWSLTDCISFVVMWEHRMNEVLTGDRHFQQAGFAPLFMD